MQTPKSSSRASPSDPAQKVSPRQLRPKTLDCATPSSSNKAKKSPNERSPKGVERRSPRSPLAQKKKPSRISELESQISKLLEDLKDSKARSILSESVTKQAEKVAEDSKQQLSAMTAKLDELETQILELSEFQKISEEEEDRTREAKWEPVCVGLGSAVKGMQQLNARVEQVAEFGAVQTKKLELMKENLNLLNVSLEEILSVVKKFENKSNDSKEMESSMEELLDEALLQLENVKQTVEKLSCESMTAMDETSSISLELTSLKTFLDKAEVKVDENQETRDRRYQIRSQKAEVEELKSALEAAEIKYYEEQIQSQVQIRTAYDHIEEIKSEMSLKEAVLEKELQKTKADIEDLKANLMDKETELQGISEENEELHSKLKQNESIDRESKLEKELIEVRECLADLKADYMDKETEFQCVSEENEILTMEINRRKAAIGEDGRAAEREALKKQLQNMAEEADRNGRKATKVAEELEIAQAENAELEAEMRRLKVQSDQWRKAAEAAAALMSPGKNGNFIDQQESLDGNYESPAGRNSPYINGIEEDLLKRKNGNMLRKIGVLWKKQQR